MTDTDTDTDTLSTMLPGRYYDDRSMYFEEISGAARGATNRLLPLHTYILSTADLIARMVEPPTPGASSAAAGPPGTEGTANRRKQDGKKCV